MSDQEQSSDHQENGSHRSVDQESAHSGSPRQPSASPRRSRSRSRSPRQRQRSRSRSHDRSRYNRHHRDHSRSKSPRSKRYPRDRRSSYDGYDRRAGGGSRGYGGGGGGGGYYSDYRGRGDGYHRDHSRSPMSTRRRHVGNRENPPQGRCLGIFGLSIYTQERDLKEVFSKYGPIEDVQIVYDAQSGRSRGFAFVYYEQVDDAHMAKERCNGIEIDGRKIRVDYSITQRAHTPTPGIYMGKPTTRAPRYRGGGGGGRYEGRHERSPSPYRERRRYSRSRSHSPRKYHYY